MKAWTLTAFYLWKDIWSRWLETPGALLARLLVAGLLSGLMLLGSAALLLAERSLEARVARMGAGTLVISEAVSSGGPPPLGRLLSPRPGAEVISLRQIPARAQDEFGHPLRALVYGSDSLPALAPVLAAAPAATVHTFNDALPAGLALQVIIEGREYAAANLAYPASLRRFAGGQPVVLVPEDAADTWLTSGWFETVLLFAPTGELPRLAAAVRALLRLEDRPQAQLQSPEGLLDELQELREVQRRAQAGGGVAAGLVVALLFGSIAVLEYRQNRYVAALLRSCGAPAPLLVARYAVEAMLIGIVAVLAARGSLASLHEPLFARLGLEAALLDRGRMDPYAWPMVWEQARWLGLGVLLSLMPVALSLRQPVGRILH